MNMFSSSQNGIHRKQVEVHCISLKCATKRNMIFFSFLFVVIRINQTRFEMQSSTYFAVLGHGLACKELSKAESALLF